MRLPEYLQLPDRPTIDADARRRIAVVVLGLVAAVVIVLAVNGASPSPGSPDPRALVPASARSYSEIHLDPDLDQPAAARSFAARLPILARQVVGRATASLPLAGAGLEPAQPWLGADVAFAGLRGKSSLELLASDNDRAARRFAERLVRSPEKANYRGVEILAGKHASAAIVGGFLVLGDDRAVRQAIDTDAGAPSLATYRPARLALSALPSPSFARAYVAPNARQPFGPNLGTLAGPAGFAVRFTPHAVEVDAHIRLRPGARPRVAELGSFTPTLTRVLPADALVYLGAGPLSASNLGLSGHLGSALPKLARTILGQLGVSDTGALARRLGPVLGKESALAIVPGKTPKTGLPTPPAFVVISKGVAADQSMHALHQLRPRFTGKVHGDRLALAAQRSALKRLSRARGSLAAAPEFRSATAGLPRSPSLELYLGLDGLVPLFEAAGLAENPAYASFAPEIHRLGAVAAALRPSRHALDATLRISVSGK